MTTLTRRGLLAMAPAAFAQPRPEPLFNGKNLDGWYRAAFGIWRIENGELTGSSDHTLPGPGYLMTQRAFRDFDLRLEFWISRGGNRASTFANRTAPGARKATCVPGTASRAATRSRSITTTRRTSPARCTT